MAKADRGPKVLDAKFVAAQGITGGALPAPTFVEVAFAGRSNVGKSSLINAFLERRDLVRTSSTPGCTRQVNVFEVTIEGGAKLSVADLPGYGFAKRSKDERRAWANLIEGYLRERSTLRTLVVLFDARRGLEEDDLELVAFAKAPRAGSLPPLDVVLVATKIDKLPRSEKTSILARIRKSTPHAVIGCSAVTGEGREALWAAVRRTSHLGEQTLSSTA
jgi:GTP-binding protein